MTFTNPAYLVETDWLAQHLSDPELRVLDCTVFLHAPPEGSAAGTGFVQESGRSVWAEGHILGSAFADLVHDLSDQSSRLRFMMPPADQFAAAISRLGVGEGTRVVLYDSRMNMWAARLWWMLRAFGFDQAAVLNGGWRKWTLEGRPVSTDAPAYPPGRFVARSRPELIAGKDDVLAAINDGATCLINALSEQQHRGEGASPYGRPGRIAGSVNVAATAAVDPATHAYLPAEQIRAAFEQSGATAAGRIITYCGGGIAASSDALLLTLLGVTNVAVYDASLSEWATDPSLPMEQG